MIKPKEGKCIDCSLSDGFKPLMAKRCITEPHYHYQNHKQKVYTKNKSKKIADRSKRITRDNKGISLANWFADKINRLPRECENCGEYLNRFAPWSAGAYVAHIVPKNNFESVMVNENNCLYLCVDCHNKYDQSLSSEVVLMKCWPIAVKRFKLFKDIIASDEVSSLRPCLESVYFGL